MEKNDTFGVKGSPHLKECKLEKMEKMGRWKRGTQGWSGLLPVNLQPVEPGWRISLKQADWPP